MGGGVGLSLLQLTFHPFQLSIGQNSCPSPTKGTNRVTVCGPRVAAGADGYVSKVQDCAQTQRPHTQMHVVVTVLPAGRKVHEMLPDPIH